MDDYHCEFGRTLPWRSQIRNGGATESKVSVQQEVVEHVKNSLRKNNYAIVHKDDFLNDEGRKLWDAAYEFMMQFARSDRASEFEAEFHNQLRTMQEFDREEQQALDERRCALEQSELALQEASASGKPAEIKRKQFDRSIAEKDLRLMVKKYQVRRAELKSIFKPYVFNIAHWIGRGPRFDDPPVRMTAAPCFLEVANDYLGEAAKIRIPTVWRVVPLPAFAGLPERKGSQLWHRDQTDKNILKVFVYYSDVDEGTGALEYVPSSLPQNSRWAEKIPMSANTGYPPQELVADLIPKTEIVRCDGNAGSLVFVDTAGLHRGGYATTGERITSQTTYLRANPEHQQTPLLGANSNADWLTSAQRYALS